MTLFIFPFVLVLTGALIGLWVNRCPKMAFLIGASSGLYVGTIALIMRGI